MLMLFMGITSIAQSIEPCGFDTKHQQKMLTTPVSVPMVPGSAQVLNPGYSHPNAGYENQNNYNYNYPNSYNAPDPYNSGYNNQGEYYNAPVVMDNIPVG